MDDPAKVKATSHVRDATGTSGIIGGPAEGVDPYEVGSSKTLDYRYDTVTSKLCLLQMYTIEFINPSVHVTYII